MKNDLIKCEHCNEEIEQYIELANTTIKVGRMCKCKREEHEKEKKEIELYKIKQKQEKLKKYSLLGKRYENVSFENCDLSNESFKKAFERCKKYCEVSHETLQKGYGMYIYGDCGTGKTHLAACMCNELVKQLKSCLITNFFEISKAIRNTFNNYNESEQDILDKINKVDFLFIDDLGTEQLQKNGEESWIQEKIYDIINTRYNTLKPTIFTSNYSLNDLVNRGMMIKTIDRVLEMSDLIIKIEGESYRRKKLNV